MVGSDVADVEYLGFFQIGLIGLGETADDLTKIFKQKILPGRGLDWRDTTDYLK